MVVIDPIIRHMIVCDEVIINPSERGNSHSFT